MNRLHIINFINPSWYTQIIEFLTDHPTFAKLIPIVALDEYPTGFNKNPHETDEDAPLNIFETIIYGISHAGLSPEEGQQHYMEVLKFFRTERYEDTDNYPFLSDIPFPFLAPTKKIKTYREIVIKLFENNITNPHDMKFTDLYIAEPIGGIGDSTIDLVNLLYSETDNELVIPYTDTYFIKGMEMFYDLTNTEELDLKEITQTWKNKKVGVMFIIQYAYYFEFI